MTSAAAGELNRQQTCLGHRRACMRANVKAVWVTSSVSESEGAPLTGVEPAESSCTCSDLLSGTGHTRLPPQLHDTIGDNLAGSEPCASGMGPDHQQRAHLEERKERAFDCCSVHHDSINQYE